MTLHLILKFTFSVFLFLANEDDGDGDGVLKLGDLRLKTMKIKI